jgi:CRISPR-associated endonuclease/helicase Cas3
LERQAFEPMLAGWEVEQRQALLAPFFGHHGRPVAVPRDAHPRLVLGAAGREAARDYIALMRERFAVPLLPEPELAALNRASWWLAGLAVIADWLGSWQAVFAYEPRPESLDDYWALARERAREAIRRAGVAPVRPATSTGLGALTSQSWSPNAVQAWAEQVALPDGPVCVFIEDMTGSGKTEAALILAHRLMAAEHAGGLYVALPTMATANAMYGRLAEVYRRMFDPGSRPSLALAHGRADLHEGFRRAIKPPGGPALEASDPEDDEQGDASSAACSAWLASESRKAFLAQVGVGTIDQALLGALPAKFQSLRLLGLADRALIIDEAHAYDAYMSEELARLLEFQAALGGSAIVLSATLPEVARRSLAAAYTRGLGVPTPALEVQGYPRVTLVSASGKVEARKPSRADLGRVLTIERLGDAGGAIQAIGAAAANGAAVAWVRNAVDDAIEAAEALRAAGHEVTLFHARMAMGDRLAVEQAVVRRFGKQGDPGERAGVVVATQVVEQSLDLDFDLMVSDLAPADLLLQRAGRLWRHMAERPAGSRPVPGKEPRLLVLSPDPAGPIARGWFTDLLPRSGVVYPDHGLLWKTAAVLFQAQAGELRVPDHVRAVVEAVYGEGALDDVPAALERSAVDAEGKRQAARAHAWANLLTVGKGYDGEHNGWQHDVKTPTRLGEEQSTFRLARIEAGRAVPWFPDADRRRAWALSEVSVRRARCSGVPPPDDAGRRSAVACAKACWPEWEREAIPILLLERSTGCRFRGTVENPRGELPVSYESTEGLRFC